MTQPDVRRASEHADGFRPDLEGLRAVAVVLVLLYHGSVPGVAGGYVGVDVFFVLSGFLITGLLLREAARTGTISLTSFYARRARRLLPASALVLLVTVIASAILMPPLRVPDVAGDATAAALYVSNIHFALQATDYLQAELAPSPILHFWSLSVEEQFYVFWPALVLLVVRLSRGRRDLGRPMAMLAGTVIAISFGVSLWLTEVNAPWAFFSLIDAGVGAGTRGDPRDRRDPAGQDPRAAGRHRRVGRPRDDRPRRPHPRDRHAVSGHGGPAAHRRQRARHRRRLPPERRSLRDGGCRRPSRGSSAASPTRCTCGTGRCWSSPLRPLTRSCRGGPGAA